MHRKIAMKNHRHAQRGAATLVIAIVLMSAVALIGLYTNRSAILEQRLSANEVRAKQAFAAANAGIENALANMRLGGVYQTAANLNLATNVVDLLPSGTLTNGTGQASTYKAVFCDADWSGNPRVPNCPNSAAAAWPTACSGTTPVDQSKVVVVSCGWSDDASSVQRLVQSMALTPGLGGTISTPVITRGTANLLTGGATVMNYFNDLTIWSGGSLLGQSNTGKTFIRDQVTNLTASTSDPFRNTGNSPACGNPPAGYSCSTQGSTLGHDTVMGDTNLSSLGTEAFFSYVFGQNAAAYKNTSVTTLVSAANVGTIVGMGDRTIWVDGNTTLPGGQIGSQNNPVVLIVDGDLDLGSNTEINGLVYVRGNITGNGSPTIYGAIIGAGSASVTGNLKVIYDPIVLGKAAKVGKASKVQGSWRDW